MSTNDTPSPIDVESTLKALYRTLEEYAQNMRNAADASAYQRADTIERSIDCEIAASYVHMALCHLNHAMRPYSPYSK